MEQAEQPGWKVTADNITITRKSGPSCNECRQQSRAGIGAREPPKHVLHVEQARIILAALADDDALAPFGRVLHQTRGFLIKLALQVFGVG